MIFVLRYFPMVADILLRLRRDRGETQAVVATRAGLANTQISKYEHGWTVPDIATLLQLLDALGQRLVVMPAPIADTLVQRDAVVTAAAQWWAIDARPNPDPATAALLEAVARLVAVELRAKGAAS